MSKALFDNAKAVSALLQNIPDGDDELREDMIEGETDFKEIVSYILRRTDDDLILVNGIAARIDELKDRAERLKERSKKRVASIEAAMLIADVKKLELPDATVSQKKVPPKIHITDEALIPSKFWKRSDPRLDRKALIDALKSDENIPGATLDNGGVTIQVRRK